MNKHTPTPWYTWFEEKNEFHNGRAYIAQAEGAPFTRHYSDVASTVNGELPEIQKANAAHIVRCVNSNDALVKALQEARSWIIGQADKDEDPDHWDIVKSINTALAAAGAPQ